MVLVLSPIQDDAMFKTDLRSTDDDDLLDMSQVFRSTSLDIICLLDGN